MQLDVGKALDEQLSFESVPHPKVRPRQHQRRADPRRRGTVALGIVVLAQFSNSPWTGQIAARELEIVRINTALRSADELESDVAAAIEAAADGLCLAASARRKT